MIFHHDCVITHAIVSDLRCRQSSRRYFEKSLSTYSSISRALNSTHSFWSAGTGAMISRALVALSRYTCWSPTLWSVSVKGLCSLTSPVLPGMRRLSRLPRRFRRRILGPNKAFFLLFSSPCRREAPLRLMRHATSATSAVADELRVPSNQRR